MTSICGNKKATLTEKLHVLLKDARLEETPLPLTPDIKLYLLAGDYPQGKLSNEEMQMLMEFPPYWAFCWSSGQVLAHWLRQHRTIIAGKRVVDFGSGSGIGAIAAALYGACAVTALDSDNLALEAIQVNAELNRVTLATTENFDFKDDEIDIIIAADVLYDRTNIHLLNTFSEHAQMVLVTDSRVKVLPEPYVNIGSATAVTCPDLNEPDEFRHVRIFMSSKSRYPL